MNTTAPTQTQAQIFRTAAAKNAAADQLEAVEQIKNRSKRITTIALGVSMPHQVGYLLALAIPFMQFDSVPHHIDNVGMALLAVAAPVVADLMILNCIETIGAPAIARKSKLVALAVLALVAGVSGTVNFLAPAPTIIKCLAAFVVGVIPMAVGLRLAKIDFTAVEAIETDIALGGPARRPGRQVSSQELKARKRAGYDQMTTKEKTEWTRNYKPRGSKQLTVPDFGLLPEAPSSAIPVVG